jgi:hypothetical protein
MAYNIRQKSTPDVTPAQGLRRVRHFFAELLYLALAAGVIGAAYLMARRFLP